MNHFHHYREFRRSFVGLFYGPATTLALLLLLGSAIGAQFGARIGRRLQGDQLKIYLSGIVLVVMFKMLYELLARPDVLLAAIGGH